MRSLESMERNGGRYVDTKRTSGIRDRYMNGVLKPLERLGLVATMTIYLRSDVQSQLIVDRS